MKKYNLNKKLNIWQPEHAEYFAYSDGKEEEFRLYKNIMSCSDTSVHSEELKKFIFNWATYYHLSAKRSNLLRPFCANIKNKKILEIGAGCGAITRYLAESDAEVTAVEGSPNRAAIIAARCKDLKNVKIIADNFENFETDEKFDIVTIIGVLEYAQLYLKTANPVIDMLAKARSHLKSEGYLIVAIENQLGLKYFCGAPEDHMQKFAFGINDSYTKKTVITFGKIELESYFQKSGFKNYDLYLPFPDYKMPACILYPEGQFSKLEWDPGSLVSSSVIYEAQPFTPSLFSLEQAWKVVARNNLLPHLSNSFLYMVSNEKINIKDHDTIYAAHYGSEKSKNGNSEKIFQKNEQGKTHIVLYNKSLDEIDLKNNTLPYIIGTIHIDNLIKILNTPEWSLKNIALWAKAWIDLLIKVSTKEEPFNLNGHDFTEFLPTNHVDAIPQNMTIDQDGACSFFDLELEFHTKLPLDFVVFRGLFISLFRIRSCSKPAKEVSHRIAEITIEALKLCGFEFGDSKMNSIIKMFNDFQNIAENKRQDEVNNLTKAIGNSILPIRPI